MVAPGILGRRSRRGSTSSIPGVVPPATNEIELFVDDPRVDWKNDREWLQEPVKPLRFE